MVYRIHIFGASGSGTTTLGKALARKNKCHHWDTDGYFWIPSNPPFQTIRPFVERQKLLLRDLEESDSWVLSGSLCGWGDFIIPLFDILVFLWIPADVRMARLRQRELDRYGSDIKHPDNPQYASHQGFLDWAADYDTGGLDLRSKMRHEQWMEQLNQPVIRLEGLGTVEENLKIIQDVIESKL